MDPGFERLVQFGIQRMEQGDVRGAIEIWRQVLSQDPDHAPSHALLSLCLVDTKRLHAAELEAGLALAGDASHPLSHHAMGVTLMARRK